jgi:uncharacterized protein YoxC
MDLDVLAKNAHTLMAFKGELDQVMPQIHKLIADAGTLAADIASIKETLAPALEWIAEQQKAIDTAKAEEDKKAEEAAAAQKRDEAEDAAKKAAEEAAAKTAAEKPPETPAASADKPLEHIAEVEASIGADGQVAERSDSEHTNG